MRNTSCGTCGRWRSQGHHEACATGIRERREDAEARSAEIKRYTDYAMARVDAGLPNHVRCTCIYCAEWRADSRNINKLRPPTA